MKIQINWTYQFILLAIDDCWCWCCFYFEDDDDDDKNQLIKQILHRHRETHDEFASQEEETTTAVIIFLGHQKYGVHDTHTHTLKKVKNTCGNG